MNIKIFSSVTCKLTALKTALLLNKIFYFTNLVLFSVLSKAQNTFKNKQQYVIVTITGNVMLVWRKITKGSVQIVYILA